MKLAATLLAASALAVAAPAQAACSDLLNTPIDNGRVVSAEEVAAGAFRQPAGIGQAPGVPPPSYANVPAFCRVRLHLTPSADSDINSEVWLPLTGWNGKYVGIGNGIWAGEISYSQLAAPLGRGYAAASTDTGHTGTGLTADWAVGHPERLVDFGHRAVHVTTQAAKAVVRAFYGRGPELSLWDSCSTGGRQGLMAAYRFPEDFDAISAMAPANPMTGLMVQSMWAGWQAQRWEAPLTPQVLGTVHAAAVRQCDALDGVSDGVIGRPLSCGFRPAEMVCREGQSEGCLTQAQASAVQSLYRGVDAADGTHLRPGWPIGSEMQLLVLTMGAEPFPVATSYFRQLVFAGQPGWDWRATAYADYLAAARRHGGDLFDVPPDGLDAFFARGGKLLLSHGWGDGLIPATNTLDFHHALYNALPAARAEQQLRLFMAPGMDHCAGGSGPSEFDTLGTIDAWASGGPAPSRIVATRPVQGFGMPGQPPPQPRAPMSRPLCAWPLVEVYDGTGDPMQAASFTCALPGAARS